MPKTTRTVNVGGGSKDANYRYKMHPLRTKTEGRGNGIKTILLNVVDVSKDLRTLPKYLTKFFGFELGVGSEFDATRQVGILRGAHSRRKLSGALQRFVNDFILCPQQNCRLPELQMRIVSSAYLVRCASCGHTGPLPTTHRLKQHIINNQPKTNRAPRRHAKIDKAVEKRDEKSTDDHQSQESWSLSAKEELAVERCQTMLRIVSTRKGHRRNRHNRKSAVDQLSLRAYLNDGHTIDEICFEMDRIVKAYDFDATKKMKLLFDVVFDLDDSAVDQFIPTIRERADLLERFTRSEKDFLLFMGCLEEILSIRQTRLANKNAVSRIFLTFYECGVFDESQLLQWFAAPADSSWVVTKEDAQNVRDLVVPFMKWLQAAEMEEGCDEGGRDCGTDVQTTSEANL